MAPLSRWKQLALALLPLFGSLDCRGKRRRGSFRRLALGLRRVARRRGWSHRRRCRRSAASRCARRRRSDYTARRHRRHRRQRRLAVRALGHRSCVAARVLDRRIGATRHDLRASLEHGVGIVEGLCLLHLALEPSPLGLIHGRHHLHDDLREHHALQLHRAEVGDELLAKVGDLLGVALHVAVVLELVLQHLLVLLLVPLPLSLCRRPILAGGRAPGEKGPVHREAVVRVVRLRADHVVGLQLRDEPGGLALGEHRNDPSG